MKTFRQLFRQPLKFVSGLLLMTMAAAILCVTVGQALAAQTTEKTLGERFTTVALPLAKPYEYMTSEAADFCLEEEMQAWLEEIALHNPDVVKQIAKHGLLSAYIPELTPWNLTVEKHIPDNIGWDNYENYNYQPSPYFMPYSCAMLVIQLEEVSEPRSTNTCFTVENLTREDFETDSDFIVWKFINPDTERVVVPQSCQVELSGTVTDVVSLQEGYTSPVGMTARLTMCVPTLEDLEAYDLVPGEQYIIYGMDYTNDHWMLMGSLNHDGRYDHVNHLNTFNESLLHVLTAEERAENERKANMLGSGANYLRYIYARYNGIDLTEYEYKKLNAISMTLSLPVDTLRYEAVRDAETGKLLEVLPKTNVTFTDASGQELTLSEEAYTQRYQIPTIAKLEGSVEDFLQSAEGAQWQATLERDNVNNHAFAVVGVDKLIYLADFIQGDSEIIAGREFTDEELVNGAKVCVIHDVLARASGLQVGDTISLNLYSTDNGLPYQSYRTLGRGLLNPSASFYFDTTPFAETERYTIVGLYSSERLWPDVARESEYSFSANTVFVPKSSVQMPMEESDSIVFNSVVLHNGKVAEFKQLAKKAGFMDRFRYLDQDYSKIAENFHDYEELSRQALQVGVAIYGILLLLYLLLYPVSQRKGVRTMQSLGCTYAKRFAHVMSASLATLVPAAVAGILLGLLLWDKVISALQTSAEFVMEMQLQPDTLVMIAAAQFALALILNLLVALFVAAPRGMSARR